MSTHRRERKRQSRMFILLFHNVHTQEGKEATASGRADIPSKDAYYGLVSGPVTILHPLHGCTDPHGLTRTLLELQPTYVVLYDPDMQFVRQLEVCVCVRWDEGGRGRGGQEGEADVHCAGAAAHQCCAVQPWLAVCSTASGVCLCEGLLLVGCLTSQQHVSVSQGRICSDNFTCCHTEVKVADQTFHLTQSQYTDTGPTNPSTDPITPGT